MRNAESLDHLSQHPQRLRYRQAKCFRSFHIDHQLELRGLLDWQVRGLGTPQNLIYEVRGASAHIVRVCAVRHQTPDLYEIPVPVDPGQPMFEGELRQLRPVLVRNSAERSDDASRPVSFFSRDQFLVDRWPAVAFDGPFPIGRRLCDAAN